MKENMKDHGRIQGNMSPDVEDYQQPMSNYSQEQFGKTLSYVERTDKHLNKMASGVRKQAYQGRYT